MADNVTLDPGTGGATVATDDAGAGGHVQIIKLAISTDGSATVIPADATNGLDVDVTRVQGNVTSVGAAADGAAVSGNPVLIAGQDGTNAQSIKTDASGELQVDVLTLPAIPAGTNNIGDVDVLTIAAGDNNIGNVDIASAIPTGTNTIGDVGVVPRTSGGLSASANLIDIDETEDEIKGTAGQVYGYYFYNDGAAEVYVKFYNATAASVVVGTTTPAFTLGIPAGSAANLLSPLGIAFSTAITIAATTGIAVADATAPAANQVSGVVFYT